MDDYKTGKRELPRRLADLLNSAAILSPVGAAIPMAQQLVSLSRAGIYRLLEAGDLLAVKLGNWTLISWESLSAYLANLPAATFGKSSRLGGRQVSNFFKNLDAIRLSPESMSFVGASEVLTHLPVRKPNRTDFFRVHPDPEMSFATAVYVDSEERETYLLSPDMPFDVVGEAKPVNLTLAVTRHGNPFLWAVPFPDPLGRSNPWAETARSRQFSREQLGQDGGGHAAAGLSHLQSRGPVV